MTEKEVTTLWKILLVFFIGMLVCYLCICVISTEARAATIGEWQEKIGVDKLAHGFMGLSCSLFLSERVFVGKRRIHRKAKTILICSGLNFAKEYLLDYKPDKKDLIATQAGITLGLITW